MARRYWVFRIDKTRSDFFYKELLNNRLRQGWGWDIKQDLRNLQIDQGAKRNLAMFNRVKKDDIILVPSIPTHQDVTIVRATDDWNKGYLFEIAQKYEDYGHIFPAEQLKSFKRFNPSVSARIRATLKNVQRFWNIDSLSEDVERIITADVSEFDKIVTHKTRFFTTIENSFLRSFDQDEFSSELFNSLTKEFSNEEWEYALVNGLRKRFPFYQVERKGGTSEVHHGTDILVTIPGITDDLNYGIAIQVKDYSNYVNTNVIDQINRSSYLENDGLKIIDKIVIITKAEKESNLHLIERDKSVKYIFTHELQKLMGEIGKFYVAEYLTSLNSFEDQ